MIVRVLGDTVRVMGDVVMTGVGSKYGGKMVLAERFSRPEKSNITKLKKALGELNLKTGSTFLRM